MAQCFQLREAIQWLPYIVYITCCKKRVIEALSCSMDNVDTPFLCVRADFGDRSHISIIVNALRMTGGELPQ